jgi:hypothetical protein
MHLVLPILKFHFLHLWYATARGNAQNKGISWTGNRAAFVTLLIYQHKVTLAGLW